MQASTIRCTCSDTDLKKTGLSAEKKEDRVKLGTAVTFDNPFAASGDLPVELALEDSAIAHILSKSKISITIEAILLNIPV